MINRYDLESMQPPQKKVVMQEREQDKDATCFQIKAPTRSPDIYAVLTLKWFHPQLETVKKSSDWPTQVDEKL